MSAKQEHWARQYKGSPTNSLEQWIYLAACNVVCRQGQEAEHEEYCRKVGAYAHEHGGGIWHACWVVSGQKGKCMCVPCVVARGEKVTCV